MLVAAALALIKVRFLSWIVATVLNAYMGQWEPGSRHKGREIATKIGYRHYNQWYRRRVMLQFRFTRCVSHLQRVATGKISQSPT